MKKLSNLGRTLNKVEQKNLMGGGRPRGFSDGDCNQAMQQQIPCSSDADCDMDGYCDNTYPGAWGYCTCL